MNSKKASKTNKSTAKSGMKTSAKEKRWRYCKHWQEKLKDFRLHLKNKPKGKENILDLPAAITCEIFDNGPKAGLKLMRDQPQQHLVDFVSCPSLPLRTLSAFYLYLIHIIKW